MLTYPSLMTLNVEKRMELQFPSVTICNLNSLKRSEVRKVHGMEEWLSSTSEFLPNQSKHRTDNPQLNLTTQEGVTAILEMSHKLEESLRKCFWFGQEYPCKDLFTQVTVDTNVCFVFNSPSANQTNAYKTDVTGLHYGLRLIMDAMQEEYVVSNLGVSAGFKIILHDFNDTPAVRSEGFSVAPGFSSSVSIQLREIHYLGYPYLSYDDQYCVRYGDVKLKYFEQYGLNGCTLECQIDYILKTCGCKGIYDPEIVPGKYCSSDVYFGCYSGAYKTFWSSQSLLKSCDCPPTCTQRIYSSSVSMSYFPSDVFSERILQRMFNSTTGRERKNLLEVQLYYDSFLVDRVEQVSIYTFESIIATFGGQMGCYLGISLLSLVELTEFLICNAYRFKSCKNKNVTPTKS